MSVKQYIRLTDSQIAAAAEIIERIFLPNSPTTAHEIASRILFAALTAELSAAQIDAQIAELDIDGEARRIAGLDKAQQH